MSQIGMRPSSPASFASKKKPATLAQIIKTVPYAVLGDNTLTFEDQLKITQALQDVRQRLPHVTRAELIEHLKREWEEKRREEMDQGYSAKPHGFQSDFMSSLGTMPLGGAQRRHSRRRTKKTLSRRRSHKKKPKQKTKSRSRKIRSSRRRRH